MSNNPYTTVVAGAAMMMLALTAHAQTQTFSGRLDNASNAALVGSDLGAPSFASDYDIANNVALFAISVPVAGTVTITSTGFSTGGVDPYFSLFSGATAAATFLASNYLQAFSTGGDFVYSAALAIGTYQVALGSFANISFAENLGTGSLASGFTRLGAPTYLGDSSYRLVVTTPVPEVSSALLLAAGLLVLSVPAVAGRRRQAR